MRIRTVGLALAAAVIMVLGLAGTGLAFHDGGVASCGSCHTMHNSKGGAVVNTKTAVGTAGPYLLNGSDQSSTCLNCHGKDAIQSGYHVFTPLASFVDNVSYPLQQGPGGDFAWLLVGVNTVKDARGHNIIATDFGLGADNRPGMTAAPGGTYPNNKLTCASCHDPHGKYRVLPDGTVATTGKAIAGYGSYGAVPAGDNAVGVYRLLGGKSYEPKSILGQGYAFSTTTDPPVAIAPSTYNTTLAPGGVDVAYGSGMSEWCQNCHTNLHNDSYPANLRHPAGNGAKLKPTVVTNYNAYVKSGDMTGTGGAAAYNAMVPFEHGLGNADRATLTSYAALTGGGTAADTTKNVMCLSCHRAHASGFQSMLRWNNTLMVAGGVFAAPSGLAAGAQTTGAYYGLTEANFAADQRSLCNKCHAKD